MKLFRFIIYLCLPLIFFTNCSQQEKAFDLKEESLYAHKKQDFIFIDYMKKKSSFYLKEGWSRLSKNNARRGIYPRSRLYFNSDTKSPVYLFCYCKPVPESLYSAHNLTVQVNGNEIDRIQLKPNLLRYIKLKLPLKYLRNGKNILEFKYHISPYRKIKSNERTKKNNFSLIFYDLILTNLRNKKMMEQYYKAVEKETNVLKKTHRDIFLQKVPSEIDFFLNLPPNSSYKAKYRFSKLKPIPPNSPEMRLQLIVQEERGKEQLIYEEFLSVRSKHKRLEVGLHDFEGIVKLGLRVTADKKEFPLQGFLEWKDASIIFKPENTKNSSLPVPAPELSELRESLQNKNIIIVVLDAARPDHFSAYGYFRPTTPCISQFARESVVFSNAFSEALTTRSSISTLFTGYSVEVTSIKGFYSKLPPDLPTLAQKFKKIEFHTTGFTGMGNTGSVFNFDRGFDEYFELYKYEGFYRKSQEYIPYIFKWLEKNTNKNFFLYIHFKEPHAVYIPVPEFRGLFSGSYKEKVGLEKEYIEKSSSLTPGQIQYVHACYDETLASVDSAFGQFVEK